MNEFEQLLVMETSDLASWAILIGVIVWLYKVMFQPHQKLKQESIQRFDWYKEEYFFSTDPLGSERSLYEKRRYGETFDSLSTRNIGLIIHALNKGKIEEYEKRLVEFIEIFKEYDNPFFNDKSGHYANLVNCIYINQTSNAHELAEETLYRSIGIQCLHVGAILHMIEDKQDKETLHHWKKKIRLRFNENSKRDSDCPWCQIGSDPELYQCPECGFKSSSTTSIAGLMKHWNNKHPDCQFPADSACNKHSMYTVNGTKK